MKEPMSFWDALFGKITDEDYEQFQRDYDPTPAQEAQQEAEDIENYVERMSPFSEKEVWYEGTTGHWRTYVTDRGGKRHYRDNGTFYAGHSGEPPSPVIKGELVEEKQKLLPVYMRLQGPHK